MSVFGSDADPKRPFLLRPLWAKHRTNYGGSGRNANYARQNHLDFGELAGLRLDLD